MDSGFSRVNLSDLYLTPNAVLSRFFLLKQSGGGAISPETGSRLLILFSNIRARSGTARLIAICAAAYVLSPIQLIPNFIPVIGCLDDVLVILLAARMIQRVTPPDVLAECRDLADAAETRRNEEIRRSVVGPAIMAAVWLLAALVASVLVATYIYF